MTWQNTAANRVAARFLGAGPPDPSLRRIQGGGDVAETLRQVGPGLWVSDAESADIMGDDFALVIDCTGKAPNAPNKIHVRPTGSTGHAWAIEDLDRIVQAANKAGGPVLIHCRRGVSRSVCAAAAVLIAQGVVGTVDGALMKTKFRGTMPASQSVSGLRKWFKAWVGRKQMSMLLAG